MKKDETFNILENIFEKDGKYFDKENKVILRNKISEDTENFNIEILKLLIGNKNLKKVFFKEIDGLTIFDKDKFLTFINNKNFLPDSYTKFSQNIGLVESGKFLKSSGKVVLNWPYKDCLLEGGQTKEDDKRNEIFFNEVLEKDEIDVLLKPKVFTNSKKWELKNGKAKARKIKDFSRNEQRTITENLVIKGNNLLALHSLKSEFAGKVKLIYIDPPYNTGNDGFKYNDNFNHSTWLTFMKNRLEIAKELLSDDGVIFVQCDDNEQAYLKVLMDSIFERDNFIANIVWENKEGGGKSDSKFFRNKHEYMLVFAKKVILAKINGLDVEDIDRYRESDKYEKIRGKYQLIKLDSASIQYSKSLDYPIISPEHTKIFAGNGKIKSCWRWSEKKLKWGFKNDFIVIKKNKNNEWSVYTKQYLNCDNEGNIKKRKLQPSGVISKFSTTQSNKHIKFLFDTALFKYSKPEEYLKYILDISTKENDIVLDFFGGSGTTGAVAHKMNRQYILIEQMDYINDLPEARLKKVMEGEQGGISKSVNWKGGGDFVYMEMKKFNEDFSEKIKKIKDKKELKKIFEIMKKEAFLSYRFSEKEFQNKISEFEKLDLENQKKVLIEILDKNQLYLSLSEIDDKKFWISEEDKEINKSFYGKFFKK